MVKLCLKGSGLVNIMMKLPFNEPEKFLDQLNNYQLFKKYPVLWNKSNRENRMK
jgi:hypothetical protein